MTKEDFLVKYTTIENKCFIKAEKNNLIAALLNKVEADKTAFSIADIIEITNHLFTNEIIIRQPVFATLFYPILSQGVEKNNIEAIKILIKLAQPLQHYQNYTKHHRYSTRSLVSMGLQVAPDDPELLNLYEKDTRHYLDYTLHELPAGVLYDSDGSDIEGCDELLQLVAEYEQACQKLALDRHETINECKFYYTAYKNYLLSRLAGHDLYRNFKDYLTINKSF